MYQQFLWIATDNVGRIETGLSAEDVVQKRRSGRSWTAAEEDLVPDEGIEPPTFGLQNRIDRVE
jgi:hypothetical protein